MKLFIVRHGESIANKKGICLGQTEGRLTKDGVKQAKEISKKLKNERIDVIFVSPLGRAVQTAKEIAKNNNVRIIENKLLMERYFGNYEGKPKSLFFADMKKSRKPFHLFAPKGVESMRHLSERSRKFLDSIKKKYSNKNILVISHRLLIRTLIGNLTKTPLSKIMVIKVPNSCIIKIDFQGKKLNIIYG